jgi:hypothetical protein
VLPSITPTVRDDIARMGWKLVPLGDGYSRLDGAEYAILVAAIDEVSEAEKDEFLELFSRRPFHEGAAVHWLEQWMTEKTMKRNARKIAGYDEMFQKLAATVAPEKRLAGLSPEQTVLALPPEILRGFSDDFLRTLPADVQKEIKKRLRPRRGRVAPRARAAP